MSFMISCRTGFYGDFDRALQLLPDAGIRHVELNGATAETMADLSAKIAEHGLTAASAGTSVNLSKKETIDEYTRYIEAAANADIQKIFTSIQGDMSDSTETLYGRLRTICDKAADLDIVICMETHPPFAKNADNALDVITAMDSPALRMNFDTANIYYYNQGINAIDELKKVAHVVGSVHLKDTLGKFESLEFPILGQGIVDYPEVFRLSAEAGLTGPFTLELEGPLVCRDTVEERHEVVKACMQYLKSIDVA